MTYRPRVLCFLALFCISGFAASSEAAIEIAKWEVFSTSVVNGQDEDGNDAPHGLWTDGDFFPSDDTRSGANFFDIQPVTLLTQFDDGTATLVGTAVNPYGITAVIDLVLSGFLDAIPSGGVYKGGGGPYDPSTQDFYSAIDGTITFLNTDSSEIKEVTINDMVDDHYFQIGPGANDKSLQLGASGWLQSTPPDDYPYSDWWWEKKHGMTSHHWDVNLDLTRVPDEEGDPSVPEPVSFAVWMLLGAVGAANVRRCRAAA